MASTTLINKAKTACRLTNTWYDNEIADLIDAALLDLTLGGTATVTETDPLIIRAVCTYCKANLGNPENYDQLKRSYDEQKAQLGTATGYTDWGGADD